MFCCAKILGYKTHHENTTELELAGAKTPVTQNLKEKEKQFELAGDFSGLFLGRDFCREGKSVILVRYKKQKKGQQMHFMAVKKSSSGFVYY